MGNCWFFEQGLWGIGHFYLRLEGAFRCKTLLVADSSSCTKGLSAGTMGTVSSDNRGAGNNLFLQLTNPKAILSIPKYSHLLPEFGPQCSTIDEPYSKAPFAGF